MQSIHVPSRATLLCSSTDLRCLVHSHHLGNCSVHMSMQCIRSPTHHSMLRVRIRRACCTIAISRQSSSHTRSCSGLFDESTTLCWASTGGLLLPATSLHSLHQALEHGYESAVCLGLLCDLRAIRNTGDVAVPVGHEGA